MHTNAPTSLIVGIVEVRQSQHVTELMADGADTVKLDGLRVFCIPLKLNRAGIVAKIDIVLLDPAIGLRIEKEIAVGPPEVFVVAVILGTITCEDEVDEVYISVTVAVVVFEVHTPYDIGRVDSSNQDFRNLVPIDIAVVLAVIQLIGTYNIEMRLELPARVIGKIVAHATRKDFAVIARIAFFVDHIVDDFRIVGTREILVVEVSEHYQSSEVFIISGTIALSTTAGQRLLLVLLNLLAHLSQTPRHLRSQIFLHRR